jgi:hypothetical protein
MKHYLLTAGVFALVVASVAWAQDAKPLPAAGQAKAQVQPAQPGVFARVTPAKMATLEEEFEMIEAHREVRKAHVRAAEVALKGAEVHLDLMGKAGGAAPQVEVARAKMDVEAAKAQLDIRMAELKEVEVKIKHAKKRLDDAKAAGVRPPPAAGRVERKQVDPPPGR